jgi:hypothetical protein
MKLFLTAQNITTLTILGILFTYIAIYKQYNLRKKSRSPFTDDALLRLPGQSLNQQILKLTGDLFFYLFSMFISATIFVNTIMATASNMGVKEIFRKFPLTIGTLFLLLSFFLFKIVKTMNYRNNLRLGYEGELVTAQELNWLMPEGNYVFHDFQAGKFNIDHIVVGPAGVFAVETKTRSKQVSGENQKDAKAIYTGNAIVFPNYSDTKFLDQAKRQSKWLSNWLKSSTGEPVEVLPIISLPGWFVERKIGYDGMFVVNPKQLKSIIKSKSILKIDGKKIQQIIHQLERKCRDIEIISKQYDSKS